MAEKIIESTFGCCKSERFRRDRPVPKTDLDKK